MPKKPVERAREEEREGKAPSTQAGEFVREEIDLIVKGRTVRVRRSRRLRSVFPKRGARGEAAAGYRFVALLGYAWRRWRMPIIVSSTPFRRGIGRTPALTKNHLRMSTGCLGGYRIGGKI